jgi:thiol-disulfide isomerase/thioredoxin
MRRRFFRKKTSTIAVIIMVSIVLSLVTFRHAMASDHPILYLFWGAGCPHCEDEKEFLKILQTQYPELEMRWFEVWDHPEFAKLADTLRKAYGEKLSSVPMTFIGDWVIIGFRSYEETGVQIEEQVKACLQKECSDALDKIKSQRIVTRIRDEAARNRPEGWELYPASSSPRKQEGS